ncbi:hypothetical protein LINGRAHAP2_LOCUS25680 [Linum grandiflorum]
MSQSWIVRIKHVYRESNYAADAVANRGHRIPLGLQSIPTSDPELSRWMTYDAAGSSQTHRVETLSLFVFVYSIKKNFIIII